jgi:hypothetical protein
MKKLFILLLICLSVKTIAQNSTCDESDQCTYTFRMESYNNENGWDGTEVQIRQNGEIIETLGPNFTNGIGPIDVLVSLCNDMPFDVYCSVRSSGWIKLKIISQSNLNQNLITLLSHQIRTDRVLYEGIPNCANQHCFTPSGIVINSSTMTSVTASWTPVDGVNEYEVVVLPEGSPVPNLNFSGIITNENTIEINDLLPQTNYELYVKSICTNPSIGSTWSVATKFGTQVCENEDKCNYTFYLRDAFGDGWNGARIDVIQNGIAIESLGSTFNTGAELYVNVGICKDIPFELYWSESGGFPGEVRLKIFDNNGIEIYNMNSNSANLINTTLFTSITKCKNAFQFIPFIDSNGNSIKDENENFAFEYGELNYLINNSTSTSTSIVTYDKYLLYIDNNSDIYDVNFTIHPEFTPYFSSSVNYNDLLFDSLQTNIYYFPITIIQDFNDVSVSMFLPGFNNQPRPNRTYTKNIKIKNIGTVPASGLLTFIKDPFLSINNVYPNNPIFTSDGFTLNYTNLNPTDEFLTYVSLFVPNIPTVSIGQILINSASCTNPGDINLNDNSFNISSPILNSYDPNNKLESHGGQIEFSTFSENDYLFYTINFENIGNASAFVVRIEDLLDEKLDESSLRMIHSSHNYQLERINNQLIWNFPNINLPPSVEDTDIGKGFVHFKIKPKPGYAIGDVIENTAEIYFDFNPPIITNTVETEFVENLSTPDFTNSTVVLSPNPTKDRLQVQLNGSDTITEISVYNVVGKRVYFKNKLEVNATAVDFSNLHQGVYMVEVITASNQKLVNKVIKQ